VLPRQIDLNSTRSAAADFKRPGFLRLKNLVETARRFFSRSAIYLAAENIDSLE
jgi:hypothetical protein